MDNSVQSPDKHQSPVSFLDEAYQVLDYERGALLNALKLPKYESDELEEWLGKGDWLALAAIPNVV